MIINPHMNPSEYTPSTDKPENLVLYVRVTQELIDKGCQSNTSSCPVALAIAEAAKGLTYVGDISVLPFVASIWDRDNTSGRYKGFLSPIVEDFIERFDGGDHVIPFNFILKLKRVNLS